MKHPRVHQHAASTGRSNRGSHLVITRSTSHDGFWVMTSIFHPLSHAQVLDSASGSGVPTHSRLSGGPIHLRSTPLLMDCTLPVEGHNAGESDQHLNVPCVSLPSGWPFRLYTIRIWRWRSTAQKYPASRSSPTGPTSAPLFRCFHPGPIRTSSDLPPFPNNQVYRSFTPKVGSAFYLLPDDQFVAR